MRVRLLGIVFENTKASDYSNVIIKTVPLNNSWGEKRVFEKNRFCFENGYVFSISCGVKGKDSEEIHFYKICKSSITFSPSDQVEGTLCLVYCKTFLLKYLLLLLWLLGIRYIGQILFSVERMNYKLFHIYNVTIIKMKTDKSLTNSKKYGSWDEAQKFAQA